MPERISLDRFNEMLSDPDVDDSVLQEYIIGDPGLAGPFLPGLRLDPSRVEVPMGADLVGATTIFDTLNRGARWRRQQRFERLLAQAPDMPIVLAEGDSWFQFPLILDDVIDHLGKKFAGKYAFNCLSAAGDTLQNMVLGSPEFRSNIKKYNKNIHAFLFSGAGNDIIGADRDGVPVIQKIVSPFRPDFEPDDYINNSAFAERIEFIKMCYGIVVRQANEKAPQAQVVIHSYGYAFPGGHPGDPRSPGYARQDQWLGLPFMHLGINDADLQRRIVRAMVDRLHDALAQVAAAGSKVHLVDVREANPRIEDWNDEIHPTDAGFGRVAALVAQAL